MAGRAELQIGIGLKPRDPAALASYADAVSSPNSSLFHHYLSRGQFSRDFGPTERSVALLSSALRGDGLVVGPLSANGLLLPVRGSVSRVESALRVRIGAYRLRDRSLGWAAESAPLLPASVAGAVEAVIGLDNLVTPHALGLVREPARHVARQVARQVARKAGERSSSSAGAPLACGAASAAATAGGGWTDSAIAHAYGLDRLYSAGDLGQGQTVAIFELEPFLVSDIATFDHCYFGAGASPFVTTVAVDGGQPVGPGSGEADLDIENVSALAPKAHIVVYEAPNTTYGALDEYNTIVADDSAKIVSTSWGECEYALAVGEPGYQQLENSIFEEAAAQGQTVFAAAGDDGSDDCSNDEGPVTPDLSVDDPGSQPYVVSAGGTTLEQASFPPVETVWNDGEDGGATGGGISDTWPMPSWQADTPASLGVTDNPAVESTALDYEFCSASGSPLGGGPGQAPAGTLCREVPDVTASADEYRGVTIYQAASGGWFTIGGTSAAAPEWAGMLAEIDSSSSCLANPAVAASGVGFVAPELYAIASNAQEYADGFTPVRSGNNNIYELSPGGYDAGPAYSLASGLGSPLLTNPNPALPGLASELCGMAGELDSTSTPVAVSGVSPAAAPVTGGTTVTVSGSGFVTAGEPDVVSVQFGDAMTTDLTVTSATSLTVVVPKAVVPASSYPSVAGGSPTLSDGAGPVTVLVSVKDHSGALATSTANPKAVLDYTPPSSSTALSVTGVGPFVGPAAGANTVTVYGSGFDAPGDPATSVSFGGVPGTNLVVVSNLELTVTVPSEEAGSSGVSCATGAGFTPAQLCQVEVVVADAAGATSATEPIYPAMSGLLELSAQGTYLPSPGTEVSPGPTEYDYAPTPHIDDIVSLDGTAYADENGVQPLLITGTGFNYLSFDWVNFGSPDTESSESTDISYIGANDFVDPEGQSEPGTTAILIAPPAAVLTSSAEAFPSVSIEAGIPDSGAGSYGDNAGLSNIYNENGQALHYAGVPAITAITPTAGPMTGGTTVTMISSSGGMSELDGVVLPYLLNGYGLDASSDFRIDGPDRASFVTSASLPGSVDVLPCTITGCASPSPDLGVFSFYDPERPSVTSLSAHAGPASGGSTLIVHGDDLTGALSVEFGTARATAITYPDPSYPAGNPDLLRVIVPPGRAGSSVPVRVTTRAGTSAVLPRGGYFTYRESPPSAPRDVTALAGPGSAEVTFAPPAADGGAPILGYLLTATAANAPVVQLHLGATARAAVFPVLVAGLNYSFSVVARSRLGVGAAGSAEAMPTVGDNGYLVASSAGGVAAFGDLEPEGGLEAGVLGEGPVVGIAGTPDGGGYLLATADGYVQAFGDATFAGSPLSEHRGLHHPIVAIAMTGDGKGYLLVTADGDVLSFGDAHSYGSMLSIHAPQPIVGIALSPSGRGYWLVGPTGAVFSFGDAAFHGSLRATDAGRRIVGIAAAPSGRGYWLAAADGAVFNFGDVGFSGSPAPIRGAAPIVGIAAVPAGPGYFLVSRSGMVFAGGLARLSGSARGRYATPVVAIAS